MALVRIDIDTQSAISQLDHLEAEQSSINYAIDLLSGIESGVIPADMWVLNAPVQAVGTLTFTATTTANDETFVICGVTFTAKTSTATGAQFHVSATDTSVTAANVAAAVTASVSSYLVGVIDCTAVGSVVYFKSAVPGLIGNGFKLTGSLTGCTLAAIAGGTNGTKTKVISK